VEKQQYVIKENGSLGHGAIAYSHLQQPVLRVFPLDQSDIFILN